VWRSAQVTADATIAGTTLVAVLLNPPSSTTGIRTRQAVDRARMVLGYEEVRIFNLFMDATPTVAELNASVAHPCPCARRRLRSALAEDSALLGAWGISGLTGEARIARDCQLTWLVKQAKAVGIHDIWMVGGEPRHPSRWHQYVSDKYGRTSGGPSDARLAEALVAVPLATALVSRTVNSRRERGIQSVATEGG
jgi:hypothetical protein